MNLFKVILSASFKFEMSSRTSHCKYVIHSFSQITINGVWSAEKLKANNNCRFHWAISNIRIVHASKEMENNVIAY